MTLADLEIKLLTRGQNLMITTAIQKIFIVGIYLHEKPSSTQFTAELKNWEKF